MRLNKIGEFGLIEVFKKMIKLDRSVVVGPGDDCAVIKFNANEYLLYTCDMITEGVDFVSKDKPELIGRKALAVSLSDIAACGGIPRYAVVSMGLPKKFIGKAQKIAKGLFDLAKSYKVNVVGGDLSRSSRLTIDVSMSGVVEKNKLVLRSGARAGDIVFVTGELGRSILGKHLKFTPRLKESRFLVDNFKINSMIDISDGLTQDLSHILKASNVGCAIYETLIPRGRLARNLADALYGGEEFELLFTLSRKEAKRLAFKKKQVFKPIGEIVGKDYGFRLIDKDNNETTIKPKGWRHF
ncbi:MAG: thiamine-phosphate kinase [Candidatus Omnitrophica bacterium]|nr:thiamine-phosphate kinase [Candidatus Omnitrophota bacterium]